MHFLKTSLALLWLAFSLPAGAETHKLVLLCTTDIHCELRSAPDKEGGWMRLATLIEKERMDSGPGKTLLIDCGDTLQGSIAGSLSQGEAAALMLKQLDYDAWIPGNHDFEFGFEAFLKCRKIFGADCLAANLKTPTLAAVTKPWKSYELNGLKLALIGMSSPHMDAWQWAALAEKTEVSDMRVALKKIMPEILAAHPDIIVLAAHEGLFMPARLDDGAGLGKIASEFPQISLIIGAHTHALEPGRQIGPASWYAQAGCHGEYLLRVEIGLDPVSRQAPEISSRLLPVTNAIPEDAKCRKLLGKWLTEAAKQESCIVGKCSSPIRPRRPKDYQSELDELVCRAIAWRTGVQVVVYGTPAGQGPGWNGEISSLQIFQTLPYDNYIGTLSLSKEQLQNVIAEQVAAHDKGSFQTLWGAKAEIAADAQINLPFEFKDERIKVAFSSHALAGGGGRFPILEALTKNPENRPEDTRILVREALRDYISAKSPLSIKVTEWLSRMK